MKSQIPFHHQQLKLHYFSWQFVLKTQRPLQIHLTANSIPNFGVLKKCSLLLINYRKWDQCLMKKICWHAVGAPNSPNRWQQLAPFPLTKMPSMPPEISGSTRLYIIYPFRFITAQISFLCFFPSNLPIDLNLVRLM